MESGFPVLTSFDGHVVNVIGHTITDRIQPKHAATKSGIFNSAALLKEFIVSDDNFFPYRLLAYEGQKQYYPQGAYSGMTHAPSIDSIYAAVVPLPEKVFLRPADIRRHAYKFLEHGDISPLIREALKESGGEGEPIISRQFVTSSSSFKCRKRDFYAASQGDSLLSYSAESAAFCLDHRDLTS
jgi:hypothetical protein